MRRARIKALAAVPVRKKPVQDTSTSIEVSSVPDTEQKKDTSDTLEQEATKNVAKVEIQEKDTDMLEQKVKEKTQEKVQKKVKNEQIEARLAAQEFVTEKSDSQEPRVSRKELGRVLQEIHAKSDQEPHKQAKSDSKELFSSEPCDQVSNNPEKLVDHAVQEKITSDVPADIVSPVKVTQNRSCFMRPIPRLDGSGRIRRNSIQGSGASASESEDEHGKRTASLTPNRIRNDSVCSVQSNRESVVNDNPSNPPRIKTMQKRHMLISESARKLAEARREFLLKHENRTPDRSQLKMYDLIYYNPVTNPMKKSTETQKTIITQSTETPEEEDEDDPVAMPVPQVKVGPDGQLIIDEQSLVIESSNAKRAKEILSTDVIVEDENSHSGGFYKKRQRGKDWPRWETLKFYHVLNVVGTDFLLMQTLFPNRTRQEIKLKYKKEEKVNRRAIEKVLKDHKEFDTELLEEQLAMLQKLDFFPSGTKKSTEKSKNEQRTTKAARKRKNRLVAKSIGECESSSVNQEDENADDDIDSEANDDEILNTRRQQAKRGSKSRKMRRLDICDKSDDNSSFESSKELDMDSDPEIYQVRPTRSGRVPKQYQCNINIKCENNAEDVSSMNNNNMTATSSREAIESVNVPASNSENTTSENLTTMIPNINEIEPGSLVILSRESAEEPGNTILQVYMVSSNADTANGDVKASVKPVELPPKLLATVTDKLEEVESNNVSNLCEQ